MSKQEMITYYFPEEIWLQILLNLPVKSLGKCMCVCKAWNCLIKDSSFISSHLNKQSQNPSRNLLLPEYRWKFEKERPFYLHFDDQEFSKYTQLQLVPLYNNHPRKIEVAGSCNGLILLVEDYTYENSKTICNFIICNPFIKKYVRLPPPRLRCTPGCAFDFCLGFDSRRNDYKVLKLRREIELYSLKRNSWKILDPSKYPLSPFAYLVPFNGVVHWIARCSHDKYLVLGFDMVDEVYKEIMLPESLRSVEWRSVLPYHKLSSIAVLDTYLHNHNDVWIMKEYGVVETWTKMFSFRTGPTKSLRALGFRKNGGFILNNYNNDVEMVVHDMDSSGDNNLEVKESFDYVYYYVESLVLVDHRSDNGANNVISYVAGDEDEATNDSRRKEGEEPIKLSEK